MCRGVCDLADIARGDSQSLNSNWKGAPLVVCVAITGRVAGNDPTDNGSRRLEEPVMAKPPFQLTRRFKRHSPFLMDPGQGSTMTQR